MTPAPSHGRRLTRVAVGVLLRDDGSVLLADRPDGKPYAGYWEFPGGKIECGEPVDAALARELHEELGIDIGPSTPWVTFEFDYPHAYVELQFRLVRRWRGEPQSREGQRLRFVHPAGEPPRPLLPAAVPALRWLQLPRVAIVVGEEQGIAAAADAGALRSPAVDSPRVIVVEADWRSFRLQSADRPRSARRADLLVAAGEAALSAKGVDGFVVEATSLAAAAPRPGAWLGAWVNSEDDLRLAASRGCDFVMVRSAASAVVGKDRALCLPAFWPAAAPAVPGDGRQSARSCRIDRRTVVYLMGPEPPLD